MMALQNSLQTCILYCERKIKVSVRADGGHFEKKDLENVIMWKKIVEVH